jgi:hypothetical protein
VRRAIFIGIPDRCAQVIRFDMFAQGDPAVIVEPITPEIRHILSPLGICYSERHRRKRCDLATLLIRYRDTALME